MENEVNIEVQLKVDGVLTPFELKVSEGILSLLPVGGFSALEERCPDGVVYEFFNDSLHIYRFK